MSTKTIIDLQPGCLSGTHFELSETFDIYDSSIDIEDLTVIDELPINDIEYNPCHLSLLSIWR